MNTGIKLKDKYCFVCDDMVLVMPDGKGCMQCWNPVEDICELCGHPETICDCALKEGK